MTAIEPSGIEIKLQIFVQGARNFCGTVREFANLRVGKKFTRYDGAYFFICDSNVLSVWFALHNKSGLAFHTHSNMHVFGLCYGELCSSVDTKLSVAYIWIDLSFSIESPTLKAEINRILLLCLCSDWHWFSHRSKSDAWS